MCLMLVCLVSLSRGSTIRVPEDYTTIQGGIDASADGDTVSVASSTWTGTGNKNLDFNGKAITVKSRNGAENTIIDCQNDGRGFYFHSGESSTSVVDGFTITNGSASHGGGIYVQGSSPTITNNIITANSASYGGGIMCYGSASNPIITQNIISKNSASSSTNGGGIFCLTRASPTITNNLIMENTNGGIGCADYPAAVTIVNNTITRNTSVGISCITEASAKVVNTILWENGSEISLSTYGTISVTYSDVQGGWTGEGNINIDPLFLDVANGDYHLSDYSPCIGAGTITGAPTKDIEGNSRGTPPDMGAYENPRDISLFVTFSMLTAIPTNDCVLLKWRTESEVHNIGFNVYRSNTKYGQYKKIGWVDGTGDSVVPIDYQFIDEYVHPGKTYFYYIEDIDILGQRNRSDIVQVTPDTSQATIDTQAKMFALLQNFPNPFNAETWVPYQLAKDSDVFIYIYDVRGQIVRTITLGWQPAGYYVPKMRAAYWDGKSNLGERVASGLYFYTLRAGNFTTTRKMVICE